ncbi:LysR family transcriptional regulator [Lactobacillus salivarius]|uniref:LysR family transcriptional regulator n=2 Tax=Ligilactobacillus salivarius TaxID=1624 RepID=A0A7X2MFR9_9LACO|nr:LysR family transcriptional regulator [Ligilactobacillus salivarius]
MELQKLKTFIDLAETLNFSKTSENLFISQSSVSKQIKSLEKELGLKLFIRTSKQVVLSAYGEVMLPYAKRIWELNQDMQKAIKNYDEEKANIINIAVLPTITNYKAFVAITDYMRNNPEVKVKLQETEPDQILQRLKEGKVDFAFTRIFNQIAEDLTAVISELDEFAVFVSKSNILSKQKQLEMNDLKDENFILLDSQTNLYQPIIKMCNENNFSPNIIYSGERVPTILDMVSNNLGISVLMRKSIPSNYLENIEEVPLCHTQESKLVFLKKDEQNYTDKQKDFWQYLTDLFQNGIENKN